MNNPKPNSIVGRRCLATASANPLPNAMTAPPPSATAASSSPIDIIVLARWFTSLGKWAGPLVSCATVPMRSIAIIIFKPDYFWIILDFYAIFEKTKS
jgi:hypothetical protein